MKRIAPSLAIALVLFAGCKKSEDKQPETKPETKKPETTPDAQSEKPATGEYKVVKPADLAYKPLNLKAAEKSPQIAPVFGAPMEPGLSAFFFKIPPGGDAGVHSHTAGYHAVVVSGTSKHWLPGDKEMPELGAGSYMYQPGGQAHGDRCEGDAECVLLFVMEDKFDFAPAPDVKKIEDRGEYKTVAAKDIKLEPFDPNNPDGAKLSSLWGDPKKGPYVFMVEFPAGITSGMHKHTSDYHAVVVAGSWAHQAKGGEWDTLEPGSYWFQPGGEMHDDACRGEEACRIVIYMAGPQDFIPEGGGEETKEGEGEE